MVAMLAVFIFGIAAFGIDLTRALVVRNEVQNAADAAALAGAGVLFPPVAGQPNWTAARTLAGTQVRSNKSEGVALATVTTSVGFWNIVTRSSAWDTSITPGANDVPALKVVVERDTGLNSGPMLMSFGRLLGFNEMPAGATAVAIITWPASAGPGALAPYAMSKCVLDNFWDSTTGLPRGDANGTYELVLGNKNECRPAPANCDCGQWTSLDLDTTDVPTVRDLMVNGNGTSLSIGDPIFIQPGMKSTSYGDFDSQLGGKNVTIPVVDTATCDLATKGECPIVAYACFHVDYAVQGGQKTNCQNGTLRTPPITRTYVDPLDDNKCIVGYLVAGACRIPGGGGGGGTYYGSYVPPRLGQ